MFGAWKIADMGACNLPQDVATGFSEAFADLQGASYIPVLYCGEQLVHGTNHMIICKQTLVTNPPAEHVVSVILHKPLPTDPEKAWEILTITNLC